MDADGGERQAADERRPATTAAPSSRADCSQLVWRASRPAGRRARRLPGAARAGAGAPEQARALGRRRRRERTRARSPTSAPLRSRRSSSRAASGSSSRSNYGDPQGARVRPLGDRRRRQRPRADHLHARLRRLPDVLARRQARSPSPRTGTRASRARPTSMSRAGSMRRRRRAARSARRRSLRRGRRLARRRRARGARHRHRRPRGRRRLDRGRFRALGLRAGRRRGRRSARTVSGRQVAVQLGERRARRLEIDGRELLALGRQFVPLAFSVVSGRSGASSCRRLRHRRRPSRKHDDYAGLDVRGQGRARPPVRPSMEAFSDANVERRCGRPPLQGLRGPRARRDRRCWSSTFRDGSTMGRPPRTRRRLPRLVAGRTSATPGSRCVAVPALAWRNAARAASARAAARRSQSGSNGARDGVQRRRPARAGSSLARVDDRVVVVGAHYDHLGRGEAAARCQRRLGERDPQRRRRQRVGRGGAARGGARARRPPRRSCGGRRLRRLLRRGARPARLAHLVREPPAGARARAARGDDQPRHGRPPARPDAGRPRHRDRGGVAGHGGGARAPALGSTAASSGDGYGPSDQTSFYAAGVPVLHLFTGTHDQYHQPGGRRRRCSTPPAARAVAALDRRSWRRASRTADAARRCAAPRRRRRRAATARLRRFARHRPDYAGPGDGDRGVLLAGVRPGGPAEQAGLRRGDLLVEALRPRDARPRAT